MKSIRKKGNSRRGRWFAEIFASEQCSCRIISSQSPLRKASRCGNRASRRKSSKGQAKNLAFKFTVDTAHFWLFRSNVNTQPIQHNVFLCIGMHSLFCHHHSLARQRDRLPSQHKRTIVRPSRNRRHSIVLSVAKQKSSWKCATDARSQLRKYTKRKLIVMSSREIFARDVLQLNNARQTWWIYIYTSRITHEKVAASLPGLLHV